jgi:hypothetical protein
VRTTPSSAYSRLSANISCIIFFPFFSPARVYPSLAQLHRDHLSQTIYFIQHNL